MVCRMVLKRREKEKGTGKLCLTDSPYYSLGYHAQTHNRDRFLSTDFGLREFALKSAKARLAHYRRFVYEKGGLIKEVEDRSKGPSEVRCAVTSELHPDGIRKKVHSIGQARQAWNSMAWIASDTGPGTLQTAALSVQRSSPPQLCPLLFFP